MFIINSALYSDNKVILQQKNKSLRTVKRLVVISLLLLILIIATFVIYIFSKYEIVDNIIDSLSKIIHWDDVQTFLLLVLMMLFVLNILLTIIVVVLKKYLEYKINSRLIKQEAISCLIFGFCAFVLLSMLLISYENDRDISDLEIILVILAGLSIFELLFLLLVIIYIFYECDQYKLKICELYYCRFRDYFSYISSHINI